MNRLKALPAPDELVYRLTPTELMTSRFGISALTEACLSLRVIRRPEDYPHLREWRRHVLATTPLPVMQTLAALVSDDMSTPEFLNPRPHAGAPDFTAEMRELARMDPAVVGAELDVLFPDRRPVALQGSDVAVHRQVVAAMQAYWTHSFAPWWEQISAALREDIAVRSDVAVTAGLLPALDQLSPHLEVTATQVVCRNPNGPNFEADVDGRGLVFVPTLFAPFPACPVHEGAQPYVLYPARPVPLGAAPHRPDLSALLGPARAAALSSVGLETTSTALGRHLGVSTSAAGQHLRWLTRAGLLEPSRRGSSVYYAPTATGRQVLSSHHHGPR